ncbi:MAG: NigD-like protein [Tannerellaceae bacterium]|nr:NigD-like protein [Tannerellaceae bacterium]
MKKLSAFILVTVILLSCFCMTSCLDDDHIVWKVRGYQSIFTVKVENDGYYFQNDEGKTFLPITPVHGYSPSRNHRAFVTYTLGPNESEVSDYAMYVHRIDSILSKKIAENLHEKNDTIYGQDPVKIEKIWIGGGFLNIKFGTYWGGKEAHFVNLLQEDEGDPFTLTFRHNSYNDPDYKWAYGWVAFDLSGLETEKTENETLKITVKVNTYQGIKEFPFEYKPEEDTDESELEGEEEISSMSLF